MKFVSALVFACLVTVAPATEAAVLYSQPMVWAGDGTPTGAMYTIEFSATDDYGFRTFDDFTLASDALVTSVTWYGATIDAWTPASNPVGLNGITGYEVAFYADNAGTPGAQIFAETAAVGSVDVTMLGTGTFGNVPVNVYEFSYSLANPFAASAGTPYWFAPLAFTDAFANEVLAWIRGSGGNSLTFQAGLGAAQGQGFGALANDRAFTLESRDVPEPSTLGLLSIVGLGALRRRKLTTGN